MLGRSIKFCEEVAHIFTGVTLDPDKWEQLGVEIIKDAALIKEQVKASQATQDQPKVEQPVEEKKEEESQPEA